MIKNSDFSSHSDHQRELSFLEEEYFSNPSLKLAKEIINSRISGFESSEPISCEWNQPMGSMQAASCELPEVDASNLSVDLVKKSIFRSGGLIVRNFASGGECTDLRFDINQALDEYRELSLGRLQKSDCKYVSRPEFISGEKKQFPIADRDWGIATGSIWAVDVPELAVQLINFYKHKGVDKLLRQYFDEPAVLSVKKWLLRCIAPNNGAEAGWHQDGRFMGENIRSLNLWLALSECGASTEAPGIEFVMDQSRVIYETGTNGAAFDWTVGQGLIDKVHGDKCIVRPRFSPGDAVIFDHYNLHRTAYGCSDSACRYAIETWFFAASRAPENQHPLVF